MRSDFIKWQNKMIKFDIFCILQKLLLILAVTAFVGVQADVSELLGGYNYPVPNPSLGLPSASKKWVSNFSTAL